MPCRRGQTHHIAVPDFDPVGAVGTHVFEWQHMVERSDFAWKNIQESGVRALKARRSYHGKARQLAEPFFLVRLESGIEPLEKCRSPFPLGRGRLDAALAFLEDLHQLGALLLLEILGKSILQ